MRKNGGKKKKKKENEQDKEGDNVNPTLTYCSKFPCKLYKLLIIFLKNFCEQTCNNLLLRWT